MKNNNIKTTTRCLTHHCNRCGYDLKKSFGWKEWLGTLFIPGVILGSLYFSDMQLEKESKRQLEIESRKPECYQRWYMLDSVTGILEKYEIKEINCPK